MTGCSAFRACTPGFITNLEAKLGGVAVVTSTQADLNLFIHVPLHLKIVRTCDEGQTHISLGSLSHVNLPPGIPVACVANSGY